MEHKRKSIPNQLRKFRKRMGYQQKDVAYLLGFRGAGRISEWEAGTSTPSIENLIKLAVIYRTLCDELYITIRRDFIQDLQQREAEINTRKTTTPIKDKGG